QRHHIHAILAADAAGRRERRLRVLGAREPHAHPVTTGVALALADVVERAGIAATAAVVHVDVVTLLGVGALPIARRQLQRRAVVTLVRKRPVDTLVPDEFPVSHAGPP